MCNTASIVTEEPPKNKINGGKSSALQLRDKFGTHFPGSQLGRRQTQQNMLSPTLIIDNPSEVWDLLANTKQVKSLPFFQHLHPPEHKTAATEVEIFPGNS